MVSARVQQPAYEYKNYLSAGSDKLQQSCSKECTNFSKDHSKAMSNHFVVKKCLPLIFILCYQSSVGQLEFRNSNVGRLMNMEDISGRSLFKKYDPDISGSPFIIDDWKMAMITLSQGKEIGPLKIKLNIENNELHYLDSSGKEMIAIEGIVKKIDCINYYSKDSIKYVFKTGYPAIDQQNENFFYHVLTEGKIDLLTKKSKYISVVKDGFTGETKKSFENAAPVLYICTHDNVRVTSDNKKQAVHTIQQFRANKSFVLSLLKNNMDVINKFIDTNKTNFKKTKDVVRLINYYNSL